MLKMHERTDPTALVDCLRSCIRHNDYQGVLEVSTALLECNEWGVVWETGKRWITDAKELTIWQKREHAARVANLLRLLAPLAGQGKECPDCNGDGGYHHETGLSNAWVWCETCLPSRIGAVPTGLVDVVPNPLPKYVEALDLWNSTRWLDRGEEHKRGWFSWLCAHLGEKLISQQGITEIGGFRGGLRRYTKIYLTKYEWEWDRSLPTSQVRHLNHAAAIIYENAVVTCGAVCPPLPEVPVGPYLPEWTNNGWEIIQPHK